MSQSKLYELGSCPDELIDGILHFVDHETLPALSLCSRRLHGLSEPHLYSTFKQTNPKAQALPSFLRTINSKPHLANYVKHYIGAATDRKIAAREKDVAKILKIIRQTDQGGEGWDLLTALTISRLRNVESIKMISYGATKPYINIRSMLKCARRLQDGGHREDPLSLARLRYVSLTEAEDIMVFNEELLIYTLDPWLSIPSVTSFEGYEFKDKQPIPRYFRTRTTPVESTYLTTHLTMSGSMLESHLFPSFLSRLPQLKVFKALFASDIEHISGISLFGQIGTMLSPLMNSIEELSLMQDEDADLETFDGDMGNSQFEKSHALFDFRRLKTVEISASIAFGAEVLGETDDWKDVNVHPMIKHHHKKRILEFIAGMPPSLEHLIIRNCTDAITGFIHFLARDRSLCHLKRVSIASKKDSHFHLIDRWSEPLASRHIQLHVID